MDDPSRKERHPSTKPRRKIANQNDPKLWKEALFPDQLPSAPSPTDVEPKQLSREELPSTVQAGEIIEEIMEVSTSGEGVERVIRPKKAHYRELLEWVLVFLGAGLLVFLVLTYAIEPIHVDGHSMENTLAPDEYVLVTKYDYLGSAPMRFDVVSCHYPNEHKTFVKRVIGLPGDTVELIDGELYINGHQVAQEFPLRKETEHYGPVTVEADQYLVMGDNRSGSKDSRDPSVGPLPRSAITGHVRQVIYPLSSIRPITDEHRKPKKEPSALPEAVQQTQPAL